MEFFRNPAMCTHGDCGAVFNFGTARETFEAVSKGMECSTDCPRCGRKVLFSEASNVLLAEASEAELAAIARSMHRNSDRDTFETRVLLEFYKEIGRRRTETLAEIGPGGEVLNLPERILQ